MGFRRFAVLGLVTIGLLSTACSGGDGSTSAGAVEPTDDPGLVRVAVVGDVVPDPATLNPVNEIDVLAADLLYDGLTRYRSESRSIEPSIAASWSTTDGQRWTFVIDQGRKFSDGTAITATTVIASLTRAASLHASSLGASRLGFVRGYAEYIAGTSPVIAGLTAKDAWTVDLETQSVNYELPALLADPTYGIVPAVDGTIDSLEAVTATSGPMRLGRGSRNLDDGPIVMTPVDEDSLTITGVRFARFADAEEATTALAEQAVDVAPLPDDAKAPDGATVRVVSAATLVLAVGTTTDHWADVVARRTLMSGLNRVAIADAVTGDQSLGENAAAPHGVLAGAACDATCTPSKEQLSALETLAASRTSVRLDLLEGTDSQAAADAVEQQLTEAGFLVDKQTGTADALETLVLAGGLDLMVYGAVGLSPSPDLYLGESLGTKASENLVGLSLPAFDEALTAARTAPDAPIRTAAYLTLNDRALESAAVIPLTRVGKRYGVSDRLRRAEPALGVLFDGRQVAIR